MTRTNSRILIDSALLLAFLMASCGGDSESADTSIEQESVTIQSEGDPAEEREGLELVDGYPADLPQRPEPNPINLFVSPEESNSVTLWIDPNSGGSISTTSVAGAIFNLTIPPGALITPEEISITPIKSIEGLGIEDIYFEGLVMKPEGLVLMQSATLTIEMPGFDLSDSLGFGTFENGEDFHLKGFDIQKNQMTMSVSHFSSVGLVGRERTGAEILRGIIEDRDYSPAHGEGWAEHALSLIVAKSGALYICRPDPITGNPPAGPGTCILPFEADVALIEQQAYYAHVRPALQLAANDSNLLEPADAELMGWLKLRQWQPSREFMAEVGQLAFIHKALPVEDIDAGMLAARAFKNAFDQADLACFGDNDPDQAFRMWRWFLLIGGIESFGYPTESTLASSLRIWDFEGLHRDKVMEQINNCFRFRVNFRSLMNGNMPEGFIYDAQVAIDNIFMGLNFGTKEISANDVSLPYEYFTAGVPQPPCTLETNPGSIKLELIVNANLTYNVRKAENLWIRFTIDEKPQEIISCQVSILETELWHANFSDAYGLPGRHQQAQVELDIIRSGDTYAQYEFATITSLGATNTTQISLTHIPD